MWSSAIVLQRNCDRAKVPHHLVELPVPQGTAAVSARVAIFAESLTFNCEMDLTQIRSLSQGILDACPRHLFDHNNGRSVGVVLVLLTFY